VINASGCKVLIKDVGVSKGRSWLARDLVEGYYCWDCSGPEMGTWVIPLD
jgi:hypothetical protein